MIKTVEIRKKLWNISWLSSQLFVLHHESQVIGDDTGIMSMCQDVISYAH